MKITDLINLGTKALEMFDRYVTENKIEPPMRVYIHDFPTTFEISEKSGSCSSSYEIIQKPDWSLIVFNFIEKVIAPLPEFSKVNQSIAKQYKKNINTMVGGGNEVSQSAFWLKTFIQRLIYEKLESTITEDTVIEYASLFKSELELSSLDYHYIHYLDGIYLETEKIEINDNILLRKVEKSDLEYTRDIFFNIPISPHIGLPSSIMEVNLSGKDEKENHEYINRALNILRLYKIGSIFSKKSISTKNSIIWSGGTQQGWGHGNYSAYKKYTIYEHEYLFNWDNVPGKDSERLLSFLKDNLYVAWAENAEILKPDDNKTIRIFKDDNSAEITIYEEEEKATLKISDGRTYNLKAKKESGELNIYEPKIDLFINFFNRLEHGLNFDKDDKKFRSIYLSLDRYNSALLESVEIDRKLMTAVMGLESLFTLEKDRGENAFKLGIRIAKLFSHLNFDPDKIRKDTEKAYAYRNNVVHGSYVSDSARKEMNGLFPIILDCLRISLIIFILKSQKISKDKLIQKIDRATISDIGDQELKKMIEDEFSTYGGLFSREFER